MSDPRGRHYVPEQETPPGSLHHGGSFRKYMENKNRKLHNQFEDEAAAFQAHSSATSKLFAGVRIHVNGLTTPSHQVGAGPSKPEEGQHANIWALCCDVARSNMKTAVVQDLPGPAGAQAAYGAAWWSL